VNPIIHSSSLTSYAAGYLKAEQTGAGKNQNDAVNVPIAVAQSGGQLVPASTPDQIKNALEKAGLSQEDGYSQSNPKARKAVSAYNQIRDQAALTQLEQTITRVDYYA